MSAADKTKIDGIEASATADQTNSEIRTAVEAATDSHVFTDADHTKLNGIEASATADQTDAEIRAAVEAATDSNVFTDADHTKLNSIEASADVTDATNVAAAGALMTSGGTVTGDVTFTGDNYNVVWDKSDNSLEFKDNARARFGDGNDLQIYHTGSISQILDIGSGDLWIGGDANINIANAALNEYKAQFATNGAVTLYHDNAAKIATSGSGISVTGNIAVTGTVDGRDVAADGSKLDGIAAGATNVTNTNQLSNGAGYVTSSGVTGISAGAGLSTGIGTITGTGTLSHSDTSSQGSVNNSGSTFIQDITLDGFGHVTGINSATAGGSGLTVLKVEQRSAGLHGSGVTTFANNSTGQTASFIGIGVGSNYLYRSGHGGLTTGNFGGGGDHEKIHLLYGTNISNGGTMGSRGDGTIYVIGFWYA
jgi:hypothetical protein